MSPSTFRLLAGILLLSTLGSMAALSLAGGIWLTVLDNVHWTCSFLFAALLGFQGWVREADPKVRSLRGWATLGALSMLVGQAVWDVMAAVHWYPLPNPADPFFLCAGPLTAVGLWKLGAASLSPADWRSSNMDAAAFLAATLAATLALFLPRQGDASLSQVLVLAAYPLGLMAPTSLALSLMLKLRARLDWRALVLPSATAAYVLIWGVWNLQLLTGQTVDGGAVNVAFSVAALCWGVGIYGYRLAPTQDPVLDRRYEAVLRMLPLTLVLLAALGVLLTTSLPNLPLSTRLCVQLGAAAVVAMAFARQALLLGERDRLIEAERLLLLREAELEGRVAERTADLVKAREAAEAASHAKSEFLANMSHEIRTPLNGVLGFAQLSMLNAREPQQQQYMDKILVAGHQLLRLINDILDMSKIEAGKLTLERIRFDLRAVIKAVHVQTESQLSAKGLHWRVDIDPDAELSLMGDPLRVEQILLNYVSNAIKFTERGGIGVKARLVSDEGAQLALRLEVQDTGIGMNEATCERLFTAFEQADNSTTRRFGGTGLGLAICRRLAHMMGGEVGVNSRLSQGSCFWVTLRLDKAPHLFSVHTSPDDGIQQASNARAASMGLRVLLAEDNELNQLLACSILEQQGYVVRVARSGEEAIALMRKEPFDCVLMDVQMPVMDGMAATRRIRAEALQGAIPIIAMTANAREQDRQACLEAGMNDFVSKPFDLIQMLTTLRKWAPAMQRAEQA